MSDILVSSNKPIKIAIASGKGGTGKTTFAVNLAFAWQQTRRVLFLDCDVEAPDAHLFLKPDVFHRSDVNKNIPQIDPLICSYCGRCASACQFHAISILNNPLMPQPRALIFPDLCHDCGVCGYVCPEGAITWQPQKIGELSFGMVTPKLHFAQGLLEIGQPSAAPVIHALKSQDHWNMQDFDVVVRDAPPGTSCAVVETIRDADLVVLVTEPTPFGIHDLLLMVQLVREMDKPAAIIINRDGMGEQSFTDQIATLGYPVLFKFPYRQEYAASIAGGELIITQFNEINRDFLRLASDILQLAVSEESQ